MDSMGYTKLQDKNISVEPYVIQQEHNNLHEIIQKLGNIVTYSTTDFTPSTIRRHDYQSPIDYCGVARYGTLNSTPNWKLTKIIINDNGTVNSITRAVDSWDNHLIASYS